MRTILADPLRRHHLEHAIASLLREGYEIVAQSEFRADLVRRRRGFFARKERIRLEVDTYGHVHRATL